MLYLAYSMVTGPMLLRRLHRLPVSPATGPHADETGNPLFSLGRWGLPVNALAFCTGPA
ncbi:hypothetical protein ACIQM0_12800 [Streptomyces sp. NPDC091387]|uniref:hypothetical protein n=1 Tax=Streptomyces sp. NPDC091387 TaxID=3365998 RepID=UPI003819B417